MNKNPPALRLLRLFSANLVLAFACFAIFAVK